MILSKTNKNSPHGDDVSAATTVVAKVGSNRHRSSSGQKGYMQATLSSSGRTKKGLTLREKIFELHDAVRVLQSNEGSSRKRIPSSSGRQSSQAAPEDTENAIVLA